MTEATSAWSSFRTDSAVNTASLALEQAPFRWTQRDRQTLPVETRGALPAWLSGQLMRTAPAAWGVALSGAQSELVRVDTEQPEVRAFSEPEMTYGEPVFVPRPGAEDANEGVLLSAGSHLREERSTLAVIDAETMQPLALCDVGLSLPLGFHGNYRAR